MLRVGLNQYFEDYKLYYLSKRSKPTYIIFDVKRGLYTIKNKEGFQETNKLVISKNYVSLSKIMEAQGLDNSRQAEKWLKSEIDKNINLVDDFTFSPVSEKLIFNEEGEQLFNIYSTPLLLRNLEKNKDPDSFPNIKELIMNLVCNDETNYDWFLKRLAISIQKPEMKCPTYVVFQGAGASGKGTFYKLVLKKIFSEKYCLETNVDRLTGRFNSASATNIWTMVDEAENSKNKYSQPLDVTIKSLTGNDKKIIEFKGQDSSSVEDYSNYIFNSNKTDLGLNLESNDRRAVIFGYSKPMGGDSRNAPNYYMKYSEEIPKELKNFVNYLNSLEFDYKEVMVSIMTDAKEQLITLAMHNNELFLYDIKSYQGLSLYKLAEEYGIDENKIAADYIFQSCGGDSFIKTSFLYDLYKGFCLANNKNPSRIEKFVSEVVNKTDLIQTRQNYWHDEKNNVKKQNRCYDIKSFMKEFNLIDHRDLNKDFNKDEITQEGY